MKDFKYVTLWCQKPVVQNSSLVWLGIRDVRSYRPGLIPPVTWYISYKVRKLSPCYQSLSKSRNSPPFLVPIIHRRVHKHQPLVPILIQVNQVQIIPPYVLRFFLILSCLFLGFANFPTKTLNALLTSFLQLHAPPTSSLILSP